MPLYQTGGYRVKPAAVNKVKAAIKDFVGYVQNNEPGTEMYLAWQEKDDPSRFLHLFIFKDATAQTGHGQSEAVRHFEEIYSPELVGGNVVFTDYEAVAGKGAPVSRESQSIGHSSAGEIVKSFYDAAIKRDFAAARKFLADDLVFEGLFETYRGPDQYLQAFTGLLQVTVRLDIKTLIAQGSEAAIFFGLETKSPVQATTFVAEWHQVKDGKIYHVKSAFDGRPFERMFVKDKVA